MIVSSVSQKSWAWYILAVFPIGMAILPVLSPAFLFQMMEPYIQVGLSLIVRSQNYTTLPDSWICGRLRVFAGVLRIFAGVLRVILGAVMCIYVLVPGIWEWPGISLEHNQGAAMFNHIQHVNCGDTVWPPSGHWEENPGKLVELDEILKTRSFQVIFQNYWK